MAVRSEPQNSPGYDKFPHEFNAYFCSEDQKKVYHFSDLLLPENTKKACGIHSLAFCGLLIHHVQKGDWQSFLESEVDKQLNKEV